MTHDFTLLDSGYFAKIGSAYFTKIEQNREKFQIQLGKKREILDKPEKKLT
jgi:hypothetical protein